MRNLFQIILFLPLFLLWGCGTEDFVSIVGQIEGVVVNAETKEPIMGCEIISVSNGTKFTDENGRFTFSDVEPGKVELTYKAVGFETITREFNVTAGKTVSANTSLKPVAIVNTLSPNKTVLDFGNRTAVQNLILKNPTTSSISYHITTDAEWITTEPKQGTVLAGMESTIAVSVDRNEISDGSYEKTLYVETATARLEILIQVIKGTEVRPSVNTISVTQSADNPSTILAEGAVIVVGSSSIKRHGFCYSIGEEPTLEKNLGYTNLGDISTPRDFFGKIPNMEYDKEYHVRAYAVNETGVGYGETLTITLTKKESAEITTKEATNITSSSATLYGVAVGGSVNSFNTIGFYYGETADCKMKSENAIVNGSESFSVQINNLSADTEYFYKAYGIDSKGNVQYGEVKSFRTNKDTTNDGSFSLVTSQPTDVGTTSATLNGAITTNGKVKIREYGFFYGTSSNPSIRTCVKSYGSPTAIGSESYIAKLTNLEENRTYYYQAYAIDDNDNIRRGSEQTFITKTTPSIIINSLRMDLISSLKYGDEYEMSGEATLYPQGNTVIEAGFLYRCDGYDLDYNRGTKIQCEIKDNKISFKEKHTQFDDYGRYYRAYMILLDGSIIYNGKKIYVASDLPYSQE